MSCDQPFRRWVDLRPTLVVEPTDEDDRARVAFLDEAERAGFEPRVDVGSWGAFDAFAGPRAVSIIRRMRERTPSGRGQRWELMLHDAGRTSASGYVLGFEATAILALDWLRGGDEEAVWERLRTISHHRSRHGVWIDHEPAADAAGDAASSFRSGPSPPGVN